jgi:hypothetical protein
MRERRQGVGECKGEGRVGRWIRQGRQEGRVGQGWGEGRRESKAREKARQGFGE